MEHICLSDIAPERINQTALAEYVKKLTFSKFTRWCDDHHVESSFYASVLIEIYDKKMAQASKKQLLANQGKA